MPQTTVEETSSSLPGFIAPFVENPALTIGSIVAAAVIWLYIRGKVEDRILVLADLKLNEGEEYVITSVRHQNDILQDWDRIQLRLTGPFSKLEQIKKNESLQIRKNLPDIKEPEKEIPVTITDKDLTLQGRQLPIGIHMSPRAIRLHVTLEKVVTESRSVLGQNLEKNIQQFTSGDPASDYRIDNVTSQIGSVEVKGPRNRLDKVRLVPENPINVSGKASSISKQVQLTTRPSSNQISVSPKTVTISVNIVNKMRKLKVNVPFRISMGPTLNSYLQKRGWKFMPEDRTLDITFRVPRSIDQDQFGADQVHPILILPPEEIQALKNPSRPHSVSSSEFIHVLIDRSVSNRDRIDVTNIKPSSIKFVPKDESS